MASHIDKKYINILSLKLDRFVWKSQNLANLRCPFCGDSKKNEYKARGYFYEKKGVYLYSCHNCGVSKNVGTFVKEFDPSLYREYLLETYKKEKPAEGIKLEELKKPPVFSKNITLPKISELSNKHPAKQYIVNRKIPQEFYEKIFYTDDFKTFIDKLIPDHGKKLIGMEERIVIPFIDQEGKLIAIQGRALDPNSNLRYMTIKADLVYPKIWGLDRYNKNKTGYVVEGPFDGMVITNSLACSGATLTSVFPFVDKTKVIFIWDNEKRNPQIIAKMKEAIELKCQVFIWPESIKEKDLNDLIISGWTSSEVMSIISSGVVSGLEGVYKIQNWAKC